jgi:hypothetical protein
MGRRRDIRSAKSTSKTVTQVVEDAQRGDIPPGAATKTGRLEQRGRVLILPANGADVSLIEAEAALNEVRERDLITRPSPG